MPIEHIEETDNLNEGRVKLNNAITAFNETVVEGDSSVEAAQARVDEKGVTHPTLKARIDNGMNSVLTYVNETKRDKSIKLGLEDFNQQVLAAIEGGEGTSFELLSIPQDGSVSPKKLTPVIRNNLISWEDQSYQLISGVHYRMEDGYAVAHEHPQYHSVIQEVESGEIYNISTEIGSSSNQTGIIFVDDDMKVLEYDLVGGIIAIHENVEAIVPENASKMILSIYQKYYTMTIQKAVPKELVSKDYVDSLIGNHSYWEGKKIIFQGDSITDPNYNSNLSVRYPKYICDILKAVEDNYAISGSIIAVRESDPSYRNPIVLRYDEMDENADLIIVAAGTNDWHYTATPLGDMESRDNHTFYGALHNLCIGLKKKYKGKTIMFMTPIMRRQDAHQTPESTNGNGKTLKEYAEIIKEVCGYYSIPVLDMYKESGLYPFDDELAIEYYNQQGGEGSYYYTHPNANGQRMMGKRLLGYLYQIT